MKFSDFSSYIYTMKKWSNLLVIIFVGLILVLSFYLKEGNLGFNDTVPNTESNVPVYVLEVLHHVQKTGKAPSGYVGGRTFQNREKLLPRQESNGKNIKYQEWDVHRKVKGKNRGAERLVTGSDENAYYTSDHYKSFTRIKESTE